MVGCLGEGVSDGLLQKSMSDSLALLMTSLSLLSPGVMHFEGSGGNEQNSEMTRIGT